MSSCSNPDCENFLPNPYERADVDRLVEHFHKKVRPAIGEHYRKWRSRLTLVPHICLTRDFLSILEDKLFYRLLRELKNRHEAELWAPLGYKTPPLFGDLIRPHLHLRTRPRLHKDGRQLVAGLLRNDLLAQQLRELGDEGVRRILVVYCQGVSSYIGRLLNESCEAIVVDFRTRGISPEHARRAALREADGLTRGPTPRRELHFCTEADWIGYCWVAAYNLMRDWATSGDAA